MQSIVGVSAEIYTMVLQLQEVISILLLFCTGIKGMDDVLRTYHDNSLLTIARA